MKQITVRVPVRADLAGGTLDLWPLYLFHPHARTVNVAVSLYASCELTESEDDAFEVVLSDIDYQRRFDSIAGMRDDREVALFARVFEHFKCPGVRLVAHSDAPRGSGLGGSSAISVAAVRAVAEFCDVPVDGDELIALVRDLETRLLGLPAGVQDYYPAVYGGVASLHLLPGAIRREPIPGSLSELGSHLILHYSGVSHFSGTNNWEIYKQHVDGDARVRRELDAIADAAVAMEKALGAGDFAAAGAALGSEWTHRKALVEGVTTAEVDQAIDAAVAAGAWGGKVCGAGGGGTVVILAPPDRRAAVLEALAAVPGETLDVSPVPSGLALERSDQLPLALTFARRGRPSVAGEAVEQLYLVTEAEGEYRPFLLAEGAIHYDDPRSGIYATVSRAFVARIDVHGETVDWHGAFAVDPEQLTLAAAPDAARPIASRVETDTFIATAADAERTFREFLCENEKLRLFHNSAIGLYSEPEETRDAFVERCVEVALHSMETERERLESTFRRRIDQMRERSEREQREADAREEDPDMKQSEVAIAWGQTLYNITSGKPTRPDEPQSINEADYLEKISQLQKMWERELDVLRDELTAKARSVEEIAITPAPRDVEVVKYLVVWAPRF
ncbi:MAG: GHMP family kinase ATP-binding protein [Thermoanaerobaculia bacterium]